MKDYQTNRWAEDFYKCFIESLKESEDAKPENYKDNSRWTSVMLGEKRLGNKSKGILCDVIEKFDNDLKIQTEKEYYRVDVIGYINRKNEFKEKCVKPLNPFLWDLLVAVEHENDSKNWLDEVCKLSYLRCPLRVVVTYGWNGEENEVKIKGVECAKRILMETGAFVHGSDQQFLIIMGSSSRSFEKNYKDKCIEKCFKDIIITEDDIKDKSLQGGFEYEID